MGDAVVLAKKSPYAVFVIWVAAIKLYGFQFGKLLNQRLVNDQRLMPSLLGALYSCSPTRCFKNSVILK